MIERVRPPGIGWARLPVKIRARHRMKPKYFPVTCIRYLLGYTGMSDDIKVISVVGPHPSSPRPGSDVAGVSPCVFPVGCPIVFPA